MKLIMAIINHDDANGVIQQLTKSGFTTTKLASTGGFLKSGNVTVMIGVEAAKLDIALGIIEKYSHSRTELVPFSSIDGYASTTVEVAVGGATVFVVDVEKFLKL